MLLNIHPLTAEGYARPITEFAIAPPGGGLYPTCNPRGASSDAEIKQLGRWLSHSDFKGKTVCFAHTGGAPRVCKANASTLNPYSSPLFLHYFVLNFLYPGQGFPFMSGFFRPMREERILRGIGGRAGVCARRTMRGERHTLMVESSLADSSSSWSAGLKATELTTSSCCRRAKQML